MADWYRYIVRVGGDPRRTDYARVVTTEGPRPEEAVQIALDNITEDTDHDLWLRDTLTITVERVR